jgi:molybdopterin-guanine dinucleotide biosynthesis protein A
MEHEATRAGKAAAVTGALLAGGRSSRMGGREKGMLAVAGKPMLAHVIARLAPQVDRMVINANGDPARFAGFRLPVVADVLEGHAGPLAGLHACLAWARSETPEARYVATVPIDTPFLPADMVARLMAALEEANARAAIAASGGERHLVVGLWDVSLIGDVAEALQQGVRAMHRFAETQGAAVADFPLIHVADATIDPFFNVNTPADLEKAGALLAALAR